MSNGKVFSKLATMLAGQDKPTNAQVVVALARSRDVDGMLKYLKHLAEDNCE